MKSKFLTILTLIFALCICTAYADGVNVDNGIKFVSNTGDIIRAFPDVANSDYTMYASATVKNESNLQKDLILLVSVYDGNNNLKKVLYDTISAPANGEDTGKVPVTIPKGTKEKDFVCKAHIWDTVAGEIAYRTESVFLDFNTNLYGIKIGDVDLENYSDDTDFYSVQVANAGGDIKVYPKSGATSIEYSTISVPGTSKIKLTSGDSTREITIKTYLEEKDKYTLSALKYKIGNTEYSVDGFSPDIQEYTVTLPVNTFYVALLPETMGEMTCTIQDINDSPNVINGISFGSMRTDTTGPSYVYEREAINGIVPIKNEHTKAYINVTDGENSSEYTINFRAVQPRLTEFNLVGASGDYYVPVFTSGAGFNNDNGTICVSDRKWAAANVSKKLIGASYFMSPYNNKGGGQWWNDVGKKGDEYFNFTADTAGTVYLMGSANPSDYAGWEKVNNGVVPTHPDDFTLGDKTWNDYSNTDYFMSCVKWNSDIGRCNECGVGAMKEEQISYIDGCVPYKHVYAKHFEAGEKVSIKHTGLYGNSAAEIIWAVVWDVDVNYPDVEIPDVDEPDVDEPDENIPEELKDIAEYAIDGYFNNQLNNNWANVTLSDETDENGVITTTASYSGTLANNSRVGTFQPWKKGQGTRENATGSYTMHFGFTVKEVTSPLALTYKYDAGGTKYLAVLLNNKVVSGNDVNGSNYIEVTAPYTIDVFMNIQSGNGYVYVNDQLLYQGGMTNSSGDKKWHEVRIVSLEESTNIRFVTTAASGSLYNEELSINDVIAAYIDGGSIDDDDETEEDIPGGIQSIESHALSGYSYKQLNNNWANITLSHETDENGIITSTATQSGTLAQNKRVGTFQPWDKNKPTYANAPGAYTMHFGFTVNEINSPASLEYRFDASKKLICFSDSKVVWGSSMNGDTYIDVTLPYTIDIFMNIQDCKGIIYVNGQVLYDGTIEGASRFCNSSADKKWTEVRVMNLQEVKDFKMVTTAANGAVYKDSITFAEVVAAYMGGGESGEDPDEPPVEPEEPEDEPEVELPEAVQEISEYALSGYFNKQIDNFWAEVTLSDVVAENGVITTTAASSGVVAAGKRIGTFQPWAEQGVSSSAAGAYTMHFGFTVNELTTPVYLEYNYNKNGGYKKVLISLSENKVVVGGSIDGETFIGVQAPYKIDIFMNIETCEGYIYVNNQLLYEGIMRNSSADKQWREVRVFSLAESSNVRFVTTAASSSMYNDSISIEDVVAAYMGENEPNTVAINDNTDAAEDIAE